MSHPENLLSDLPALLRRAALALWGQSSEDDPRELGRILMGRAGRLEESGVTEGSHRTEEP